MEYKEQSPLRQVKNKSGMNVILSCAVVGIGLVYAVFILIMARFPIWIFVGLVLFKYWSLVIPTMSSYLHISSGIAVLILVTAISTVQLSIGRYKIDWHIHIPLPIWQWRNPRKFLYIDLIGGLLPVVLALYQLTQVPLLAVLVVGSVAAVLKYLTVYVFPGQGVCSLNTITCLIALICALLASLVVPFSPERLDVSVAFSSSVLGSVIGADLLHLRNLRVPIFRGDPVIGGDGSKDGIFQIGLFTLFTAAWFPEIVQDIRSVFPAISLSENTLTIGLIVGAIAVSLATRILVPLKRGSCKPTNNLLRPAYLKQLL